MTSHNDSHASSSGPFESEPEEPSSSDVDGLPADEDSAPAADADSGPKQDAGAGPATDEMTRLQRELDEARTQNDQLRRHVAEMDNSRKRLLRDRDRDVVDKQISLLKGLLPVVDNFERALASLVKTSDPEAVKTGTEQIFQLFVDYLARHGVAPIPGVGQKYDPVLHEAVVQLPSAVHASGLISAEVERGYLLGERVLRHSKVVVSTGPAVAPDPQPHDAPAAEPE